MVAATGAVVEMGVGVAAVVTVRAAAATAAERTVMDSEEGGSSLEGLEAAAEVDLVGGWVVAWVVQEALKVAEESRGKDMEAGDSVVGQVEVWGVGWVTDLMVVEVRGMVKGPANAGLAVVA